MSSSSLAPDAARRHAVPIDVRPWHRELIVEALDGAVVQTSAAIRFLERGDDDRYAKQAIGRAYEFMKCAVGQMNELSAENRRLASRGFCADGTETPSDGTEAAQ